MKQYLAIESSCDETSCAVICEDGAVLSNIISSQVDLHARYGGVVPELASRAHLRNILPVCDEALLTAGKTMQDIDAISVTRGPGLVGSLLAGFETAKTLGYVHQRPVYAVHHVAAHVHSVFIRTETPFLPEGFAYPYLALAVSGGHSSLILAQAPDRMSTIGRTRDDAAGEAYDKVAKLLGLPYPGGPVIDRLAASGNPQAFSFTKPRFKEGEFDFSFSGIKAAVARLVEKEGRDRFLQGSAEDNPLVRDLAASFQSAMVDILLDTAQRALRRYHLKRLAVVGGVACNRGLRAAAQERFKHMAVVFPPPSLCTDNAAMIGALAAAMGEAAPRVTLDMNVDAKLKM